MPNKRYSVNLYIIQGYNKINDIRVTYERLWWRGVSRRPDKTTCASRLFPDKNLALRVAGTVVSP